MTLPDSVIKIIPNDTLDVGYNNLDTNILSDTVISWLDKWDPDWRLTQNVPIIYNTDFINKNAFSLYIKNSLIHFYLPTPGNIKLLIYNIKGKLLSTLVNSYKKAGYYKLKWDIKRNSSGVYFIKLCSIESTVSKKLIVIK